MILICDGKYITRSSLCTTNTIQVNLWIINPHVYLSIYKKPAGREDATADQRKDNDAIASPLWARYIEFFPASQLSLEFISLAKLVPCHHNHWKRSIIFQPPYGLHGKPQKIGR